MPGKAPRQKGDRFERWCVNALQAMGVPAKRVPLSGAAQRAGAEYQHDLRVVVLGESLAVECKERAAPFLGMFYRWFAPGPRYLFVKATRGDTLVVMKLDEFARLVRPNPEDWSV
jgi:hypothetical protein